MGLTEAQLADVYEKMKRPLFNVLYRYLWNANEAEDAMHDAFVKVWLGRARVLPEALEPLIWQAALNLARNRLRGRKLWRWVTLEALRESAAGDAPDDQLARARREHALRKAIEALPERLRSVVLLCELGETSYASAARILGVPAGTIASRRHQAMKLLRGAGDV